MAPVCFEQVSVTVNTAEVGRKRGIERKKKKKSFAYVSLFTHTRCELQFYVESQTSQ